MPWSPSIPRPAFGLLPLAMLLAAAALAAEPAPHPAPLVSAPAEGASLHGVGARFAWTRSPGLRYRLQVARDDAFADLVVDRAGLDSDEAIVALPPGDYLWRVADAAADAGSYSDARRFTLRPVPQSPPPEPPQMRDGALTLRWRASSAGETYEAELARDPMFADVVARHAGPDPQMVLRDPAAGVLYLRVRAIDATGYAGPYGPAHAVDVPRARWWHLLPPLFALWWLLL